MPTLWTTDLLPGSCAHEAWYLQPQRLPTNSPHIPCDEGFGEARFGPLPERSSLDTAVCLPDQLRASVEDAVIQLLQRAHSHLYGAGRTVGVTSFDFSSAFNTIPPLLLSEKRQTMMVDSPMVSWVTAYLTDRPQFVCLGTVLLCLWW